MTFPDLSLRVATVELRNNWSDTFQDGGPLPNDALDCRLIRFSKDAYHRLSDDGPMAMLTKGLSPQNAGRPGH